MFGKEKRFEIIHKDGGMAGCKIILDKNTGVQYLYAYDGYGGGVTVLVDKDGKPILYSDDK
ncbi:DUF6440 family protein [Inconstantimicrobium mannanitabidum]|uniref:Uncharacterized protein n=1 Tax=Inconstantimicrobium mannanitabidum TaxID=1604901 RepID=A0ACB5R8B4_9CLOT|nr:DUF6440 family protein [Clostridium sp. TW13]GKX65267.1 hypothetical protein rsdtw13_05250 [Clostridium sp. TW13]